ncbi:hypothetical protein TorRG33x02_007080 [Trema orientale]|uniref:Uncharacterized protein n=1 Tax=Trema orientale TaxID=63057 RepID=A0A2P5G0B9_TREOI|nr:hypothetical protein TorRG33x02_007080 [Trema orientale]
MLGERNYSELKTHVVLGYGTEEDQAVSIEVISFASNAKAAKALKLKKTKTPKKTKSSPSYPLFVEVLSSTMTISVDSDHDSLALDLKPLSF